MRRYTERNIDTFTLNEFDPDKIYAFRSYHGHVFKLHRTNKPDFSFISLNDSTRLGYGKGHAKEQISRCSRFSFNNEGVFEFDNLREFVDWLDRVV